MIVPNLIAIALMLAVGYVWSSRGFFSSLLNLLVTIAAGAVAFGLWETVALAVIGKVDNNNRFIIDVVWGGSLVVLFVLAMAVISLATNAVMRANIIVPKVVDWVGGAVCGLGAGLIVSGITLIGTSQIRTPEIDNLIQFNPVDYDNNGYLVRTQLWVPTDTWTAGLYNFWSERSMRETFGGGKTMGAWHPHVADEGHLLRIAETDVLLRYSLNPKDVSLGGRYTVGKKPANATKGYAAPSLKDLVGDSKPVGTLDGTVLKGRAYIEGFVVRFDAGAKEKGGQVAIGAGSATLVCRNASNDRSLTLQPIAVISQAKGGSLEEGRWRFDTKNFFVGSMGGQASVPMAFEFLVPDEYADNPQSNPADVWHPIALYVRGVRFDVSDGDGTMKSSNDYLTAQDRSDAIEGGGFLRSVMEAAPPIVGGKDTKFDKSDPSFAFRLNNHIPGQNMILNGGEMSGVELSKGQQIINCVDFRIQPKQLADNTVERSLRVENFQPGPDTVVISLDVSRDVPKFAATEPESSGATGAPTIVDGLGQRYPAIGYVYRDRNEIRIRFTPGSPLASLSEAPSVSRSRDDQKLFLVFRVARSVKITQYAIGSTGIVNIQGTMESPSTQENK